MTGLSSDAQTSLHQPKAEEWRFIGFLQAFFFISVLWGLDAPFVSMHFERQNYTFDITQHVFHDGWSAVVTPKASFSELSNANDPFSPVPTSLPRFIISHFQVPFHGLIGWPAAMLFKQHERAVARLVSVMFALLSIRCFYLVARNWLEPNPALIGTTLWTTAPLVMHFGQVPVPDILAVTGMAAAFLFALQSKLMASSATFLFAILAKMSVIIYGLPILVALLIARNCHSIRQFIQLSLGWGIVPLTGILAWLSLSLYDPLGSNTVLKGYSAGQFGPVQIKDLLHPGSYLYVFMCILPFGCGVLGILALLFALEGGPIRMNPWLKGSIVIALLSNYLLEDIIWHEAQYTLPVLFWSLIAASFGLPRLLDLWSRNYRWRIAVGVILFAHAVLVVACVWFLKAPRVPNWRELEAAGKLTPIDARVVVYADAPDSSPPVWVGRNTLKLGPLFQPEPAAWNAFAQELQRLRNAGFDYVVVFDVEDHYSLDPLIMLESKRPYLTNYTDPSSPTRRFFDNRYQKIFEGDHVVLYRLVPL